MALIKENRNDKIGFYRLLILILNLCQIHIKSIWFPFYNIALMLAGTTNFKRLYWIYFICEKDLLKVAFIFSNDIKKFKAGTIMYIITVR